MTTSYDVEVSGTEQHPTYDSQGHQVWNPSVGIYHKPAKVKRESYGGIIGALQDTAVAAGLRTKAYPENFAGIIAAIQDLTAAQYQPPVTPDVKPPGGIIDINPDTGAPDWIVIEEPMSGDLWFDTRQGRLFVWVEDDWYQTNGADGLPIITTDGGVAPETENLVPGQFWWDAYNGHLYIYDGKQSSGQPLWRYIAGQEANLQTTATLPLVKTTMQPRAAGVVDSVYPPIDLESMDTQEDYNGWLFTSLLAIETALDEYEPVTIGTDPPGAPKEGDLWYDTESLELSIYYVDADRGQWVPTATAYNYDDDLDVIRSTLARETRLRETAIHDVLERLGNINIQDQIDITGLEASIAQLQQEVAALPTYDLSPYQTKAEHQATTAAIVNRLDNIVIPDVTPYAKEANVNQEMAQLQAQINLLPTSTDIPDVSSFVTQQNIDTSIAGITTEYLPRTGGTLSGSFTMTKSAADHPGFDFSTSPAYSKNAMKFQAISPTGGSYSTFGTTNKFWEYAWDFSSHEDFCWVYNDSNKVFSITKDGPACSQLYIGDFHANDSSGRVITNKIDVKDRLTKYQTAFEHIRQAVSSSTDYASLKSGLLTALAHV